MPPRRGTRGVHTGRTLGVCCFVCFVCCVDAIPPHPHKRLGSRPTALRSHLRGVRHGATESAARPPQQDLAQHERWITQPLDHFHAADVGAASSFEGGKTGKGDAPGIRGLKAESSSAAPPPGGRTWRQRWFVNDAYFDATNNNTKNPVIFLCVGGEGPGFDSSVVVDGGAHCGVAVAHAKELFEKNNRGALLVALEHRFYGSSQPTGDLSVGSLRFLTSTQALGDLVRFIEHLVLVFELPPVGGKTSPSVVAFGGSYPGMLASFVRQKFPHLVLGAVASSAPVQASFAMPGYDFVVGESLADESVGGSFACFYLVRQAFDQIARLLSLESNQSESLNDSSGSSASSLGSQKGRRELEKLFNTCGRNALDVDANVSEFLASLTEVVPAQSNDPRCDAAKNPACDIAAVCRMMIGDTKTSDSLPIRSVNGANADAGASLVTPRNSNNGDAGHSRKVGRFSRGRGVGAWSLRESIDKNGNRFTEPDEKNQPSALDRFAAVTNAAFGFTEPSDCLDVDHSLNLAHMADDRLPIDWPNNTYDGDRAWFWQTCVEFGFYQTCEDEKACPLFFTSPKFMTLNFFAQPCVALFGLDFETVVKTAAFRSNALYGGWCPASSHVLYPSGSVDPWRANSFTPNRVHEVPHKSKKQVDSDTPSLMVKGASHHAWTHPARPGDQESVVLAREVIKRTVDEWLARGEGNEEL